MSPSRAPPRWTCSKQRPLSPSLPPTPHARTDEPYPARHVQPDEERRPVLVRALAVRVHPAEIATMKRALADDPPYGSSAGRGVGPGARSSRRRR